MNQKQSEFKLKVEEYKREQKKLEDKCEQLIEQNKNLNDANQRAKNELGKKNDIIKQQLKKLEEFEKNKNFALPPEEVETEIKVRVQQYQDENNDQKNQLQDALNQLALTK